MVRADYTSSGLDPILLQQHEEWLVERKYFSEEAMSLLRQPEDQDHYPQTANDN